MRDFNEIKAEILRRSDNRIKEKKRKRKIYTAYALSLCLCVTVAAALFPKLMRFQEAELADKAPNEDIYTETTNTISQSEEMSKDAQFTTSENEAFDTTEVIVVSVELKSEKGNTTLSDFEDVKRLSDLIDNLYKQEEATEEEMSGIDVSEDYVVEEESEASTSTKDESCEKPIEYPELVIKYSDGSQKAYRINDKSLENAVTGDSWPLTESEYDFIVELFSK